MHAFDRQTDRQTPFSRLDRDRPVLFVNRRSIYALDITSSNIA